MRMRSINADVLLIACVVNVCVICTTVCLDVCMNTFVRLRGWACVGVHLFMSVQMYGRLPVCMCS